MFEQEEPVVLPERTPTKPLVSDAKAKQDAYYATYLSKMSASNQQVIDTANIAIQAQRENFYSTYNKIHTDLTTKGESPDLEAVKADLTLQENQKQKEDLLTIAADPYTPVDVRATALESSKKGYKFDLSSIYARKVASEDASATSKDFQAQDKNIAFYIERNKQAEEDTNKVLNTAIAGLDITGAGFAKKVALDFVPGHSSQLYVRAANALMGKSVTSEDAVNFALVGSTMRDMGKTWANWNDQQRLEGAKRLTEFLRDNNITDVDSLEIIQTVVDNPDQHTLITGLMNAGSLLDLALLGGAIKAPVKTAKGLWKWATTYDKATDVKAYNTVKGWVTGKGVVKADVAAKAAGEATNQSVAIQAATRQEVPSNSPLGKENTNNPDKAVETSMTAILDDSGEIAKAITPEGKGQVIQTNALPKNVSLDETISVTAPDISEKINIAAKALVDSNIVNPALYNDAVQRSEIGAILSTIKQTTYPSLHLNKTLVDYRFGDTTSIKAIYGESPTRGWLNEADAITKLEQLKKEVPELDKTFRVEYSSRNQEYFIVRDIEKSFNPNILVEDTSATFQIPYTKKEINIDGIARSKYINWFLPASSRIANGLHSSVMATEMGVAQKVSDLNKYINNFIMNKTDIFPDLNKELRMVQEHKIGQWKSTEELLADKHHLNKQQKDDLVEAYYATKALGDNLYEVANKRHRRSLADEGHQAIYLENGSVYGYGKQVKPSDDIPTMVWDLENNVPVILQKDAKGNIILEGKNLVELNVPVKSTGKDMEKFFSKLKEDKVNHSFLEAQVGDNRFKYAVVGGKTKLGELPDYTLAKTDPYIPWYHTADFFIQRTPKQVRLNGHIISYPKDPKNIPEELKNLAERMAGARTEVEANQLKKELEALDKEGVFVVMKRREDVVDDMVDIHEEANKMASWEKHRGERLKGFDPLDDPIRSLAHMGKSLMQLDAWEDVKRFFEKRMIHEYGDILPQGQIPKSPNDWKLMDEHSEPKNIPRIAAAKREIEWFNGVFRSMVESDRAVSSSMHLMADVLNKYGKADNKILRGTEKATRDLAKQGNVFIRVPNAAATHLLLYSNILRQWVVQPQNLFTLHAMDIGFAKYGTPNLLPFLFSILGTSKYFKNHADEYRNIAKHIGGTLSDIKGKEWDDMYDGFVKSGMLQAIDLNQIVLGLKHHDNYSLAPEIHEQIAKGLTQTISWPGNTMKMFGYTPAELLNLVGGWLYSYNQYKKLNPKADMTNPHVIEQVKAKALALTGSMAGNADTLAYQKGMWTLLFKFMPIQSKQLALMTTSKYTTKEEKLRIAIGQTVLWGVPGTVGGVALMDMVKENASDEEKAIIRKYEGGITDLVLNKILDVTFRDVFGIDSEKDTSLGWSASMAPFNNGYGVPTFDVLVSLWKTFTDAEEAGHTRIAALGTYSILKDMYYAIKNRFTITGTYDTPEATQILIEELPKLAKGWDNLSKSYVMYQTGHLVSKQGNPRNLVASAGDAFGRMFGVYTKEELDAFKNINVEKAKRSAQKAIEKDIFNFIMANKQDLLNMNRQSRAPELDKMLHIMGHNDPEMMKSIRTNIEKKIYFANKDLADAVTLQAETGMQRSRTQAALALKEAPQDGSLFEFLSTLFNGNKE